MPFGSRPRNLRRLAVPILLGRLARARPISDHWGYDRGQPIDRYFIERFLAEHRADIRGQILEVKSDDYARRFGSSVERVDVLDIDASNTDATIVGDLAIADTIPAEAFDCFVLTQTLQYVYDLRAAVRHAHRLLRQGGVLLVTVPSLSRLPSEAPKLRDFWRFTEDSCRDLLAEAFGAGNTDVRAYGNVLTSVAFLAGLAAEDLPRRRLDERDERFPLLVAARAVKA